MDIKRTTFAPITYAYGYNFSPSCINLRLLHGLGHWIYIDYDFIAFLHACMISCF